MSESRTLVLYHGSCADGFTAAWASWLHFGDTADYLPVHHGDDPPDVTGREVYVLDFSWRGKHLLDMATSAKKLTVIDHHSSSESELMALAGRGATVSVVFDVTKSGAMLAWEFFHPGKPAPFLVSLVQDRDLWRHELPDSRELNAWLSLQERTFPHWSAVARLLLFRQDGCIVEGQAILAYQATVIRSHVKHAAEREIGGHKVLVANATTLISEITGELANDRPFGATYRDQPERGLRVWSLRSREGGVDVSQIARSLGGGGHRQAAGYQESLPG